MKKGDDAMADKFTKEDLKKAFFELADEMERECGDWENTPDNPELKERIIKAAREKCSEKLNSK